MPRQKATTKATDWVVKDRTYQVVGSDGRDSFPTSFELRVNSTQKNQLLFNDDGVNRAIRYCTNQASPFLDEQEGESTLGRVVFFNGRLVVKKENVTLQKLLSNYHPQNGVKYYELDFEAKAEEEINLEKEYVNIASKIFDAKDFELKVIARVILGSKSQSMSRSEMTTNLISKCKGDSGYIKRISSLLEDEDLNYRSVAYASVDFKKILISEKKNALLDEKGNHLVDVKFDEDPYDKLVLWFKNKEGQPYYDSLRKELR